MASSCHSLEGRVVPCHRESMVDYACSHACVFVEFIGPGDHSRCTRQNESGHI